MEHRIPIVGFLDSGIGGLTVLYEAKKLFPGAQYLYYADVDHVPYGTKTCEQIQEYVLGAVTFLLEKGVDILVLACNTATSMAIELLRSRFAVPIIGMEPAIRPAVLRYPDDKILVCATPATIRGERLHHLLDLYHTPSTVLVPLPELVSFAETGQFSKEIVIPYLASVIPMDTYAACVLGCTHFTLFRDSFIAYLGENTACIDGNTGTVNRMCAVLKELDFAENSERGETKYYLSGREISDAETLQFYTKIYDRLEMLHHMDKSSL